MTIKPIKSEADYRDALQRLEVIFDAEPGTTESDGADVLGLLIDEYDRRYYPIDAPDPILAIKIRINMFFRRFLSLALLIFAFGCENKTSENYDYDFQFVTEIYKPFNYLEDGNVTGYAPDLLKEICHSLDIPFQVSVMDWEAAYGMAQNTPGTVLFSTSMNAQRRDLFKWAGPIASLEWQFYALAERHVTLKILDDAKDYPAIGVLKDYTLEQFLVSQGFTNLVYCKDHTDAIQKLMQGTIDLYPCDRFTMEAGLASLGKSFYSLEEVLPIKTEMIYFAFHKSTPDHVVTDIQEEINHLKNNGFVRQLYQKYLNSTDYPGTLIIFTEDYPPITFMNRYGEISGYGSDIVKEIMKRNRSFEKIHLSAWSNGYELALNNPNFCLFTMDRTPIRESLFRWVGPIGTNTTWFYVTKKSGVTLKSLEDAKKLAAVGTVSSWFSDQHLRQLGFSNLSSGKDPVSMAKKLMAGEIDAFVCSGVTFPDILTEAGYRYEEVVPALSLMSSDYYISFSKSTDNAVVQQWQTTFDAMVADGTVAAIRKRWFPE